MGSFEYGYELTAPQNNGNLFDEMKDSKRLFSRSWLCS
jgi:hypothetical protein